MDCPQRDERLGWAGDIGVFGNTALFLADVAPFLEKWLIDLADAQEPSGAYRDFAPVMQRAGSGNAAWADAGVLLPWALYEHTGDATVLERQYDSMHRYLGYLEADHTGGIRRAGRYGDWVSLGERTPKDLLGTAFLARSARTFTEIARLLGRAEDTDRAAALADLATGAFRRSFINDDGTVTGGTQTGYALALGFGLVPPELRSAMGRRLADAVRARGLHLSTGFVGTPLRLPALSESGHHDVACALMRQPEPPGWVFEVRQGATTIWERWTGWTPEAGFAEPRMNSFNHYAFGSVGEWMHRHLAGLAPAEPGYRRMLVRPGPGAGFTWARASHVSPFGRHAVDWVLEDGTLTVRVQAPPATSADVLVPPGAGSVRVDGAPTDGVDTISLASGSHKVTWSRPGT
jgi:alpha-L-rhamnosidase